DVVICERVKDETLDVRPREPAFAVAEENDRFARIVPRVDDVEIAVAIEVAGRHTENGTVARPASDRSAPRFVIREAQAIDSHDSFVRWIGNERALDICRPEANVGEERI